MDNPIIKSLIKRNGYLDNVSVHSHLKDVLGYQDLVRRYFKGIPEGIWEIMKFSNRIDLVCLDGDYKPLRFKS